MAESKLVLVPLDSLEPSAIQPRVNVAADLIAKLAASMKAGRHEPLLEVESISSRPQRFQILCGEQRWRAAREAGLKEVLVRVHPRLGYLERLTKQYEENRLRADLDPVEEGACILAVKTIQDALAAERLLREAHVPFRPLNDKRIERREQFAEHLEELRRLLRLHGIEADWLSRWRDTEKALGISETQRKYKVGILRLDPALQDAVRDLPIEHAMQISRVSDPRRQAELAARAPDLTYREIRHAAERLRRNPKLSVEEALGAPATATPTRIASDRPMELVADLCRQLTRLMVVVRADPDQERKSAAALALNDLRRSIDEFLQAA